MAIKNPAALLVAATVALLLGGAAAEGLSGRLTSSDTSVLQEVSGSAEPGAATQRTTACPKCTKKCPKPRVCPKPKPCPSGGGGITCANFRSTKTCAPYNSGTLDLTRVAPKGRYKERYTENPPFAGAKYLTPAKALVDKDGVATYASAVAFDGKSTYAAVTVGVYLKAAGCKFDKGGKVQILNGVLVYDVSIVCSGKYLVSPV